MALLTSRTMVGALDEVDRERERVDFLLEAAKKHQVYSREYLPRLFGNDRTLKELKLRGTHLSDLSVGSLVDALKSNTVVTSLDLSHNFISAEGAALLAQLLEVNTTVQQINLGDNRLDPAAIQSLVAVMWHNRALNLVNLEGNPDLPAESAAELYTVVKLNFQPRSLKLLVKQLQSPNFSQSLQEVDLSVNVNPVDADAPTAEAVLDDFSAQCLAEALRKNRTVRVLLLRNNRIGDEGAKHLAWMLELNCFLEELDLFGNVVAAAGCHAFVEVIMQENNTITLINMRNNCVSDDLLIELEWALTLNRQPLNLKKFLPPVRQNDPDLVHLRLDEHLSQRFYDDVSARLLAGALQTNTCVTALELPNNVITEVGAHFLADMLRVNTTLRHLDLAHNRIGAGVRWLSDALRHNTTLSSLVLAGNQVEDTEAELFAEMLATNVTLLEVDLQDNLIEKSAAAFGRSFAVNSVLQDLKLRGNRVSATHMHQIQLRMTLNGLPRHVQDAVHRINTDINLEVLDLTFDPLVHGVPIDDAGVGHIAAALANNFTVRSLILSENELTIVGIRSLSDMLYKNIHTLTHLDVSRNKDVGPEAAEVLAHLFTFHRALTSLDVSYNNLGNDGVHLFMRRAEYSPTLKVLNVEGCRCSRPVYDRTEIGTLANRYAPVLKDRLLSIFDGREAPKCLDLAEYKGFGSWQDPTHSSDGAALAVAKTLRHFDFFDTFVFRRNRLGDDGCKTLASLFAAHCRVTSLDVADNCITDVGAAALIDLVKARHELLFVKAEGNTISEPVLAEIARYTGVNRLPKYVKDILLPVEANDPSYTAVDVSAVVTRQIDDGAALYLVEALKRNTSVTAMNLSNQHLGLKGLAALCDVLKGNAHVRTWLLSNNGFAGRPAAALLADLLRVNSTLQTLGLRANEINEDGAKDLLVALEGNDTLTELDLRDNGLSRATLTALTNQLHLNVDAGFKRLLPQVRANTMTELDLSGRQYDDRSLQPLAAAVAANTSLVTLGLARNLFTDEGVAPLAAAIRRHPTLQWLDLSHNAITVEGCQELAEAMKENTALQRLALDHNRVTPAAVPALAAALRCNGTLMEVTLHGNPGFDDAVLEEVACLCLNPQPVLKAALGPLQRSDPSLTVLDFSRGQLRPPTPGFRDELTLKRTVCTHTDVTCVLLRQPLEENTALHTLNLSNGHITDRGAILMSEALMLNRTIVCLGLANNELTSVGARRLADVLLCNGVLTDLGLRRNRIDEVGAAALLGALSVNHTCRRLNLDLNPISDETQLQVGYAVTLNNQPRTLKAAIHTLREGEEVVRRIAFDPKIDLLPYDDVSCQLLADVLRENTTVTELDLRDGRVTDTGVLSLCALLKANTALRRLNLERNGLLDSSLALTSLLRENHTLRQLQLTGNQLKEADLEQLGRLVALNGHPPPLKPFIYAFLIQDKSQKAVEIHGLTEESISEGLLTKPRAPLPSDAADVLQPPTEARLLFMTDPAVRILAEYLKTDIYCDTLVLAHNRIGNGGASCLAEVLRINDWTLSRIDLSHNLVQDSGAIVLARALATHRKLTDLNLSHNLIEAPGAAALLSTVKNSTVIKRLEMFGNPLDYEAITEIALYASANCKHPNFKSQVVRAVTDDPTLVGMDFGDFASRNWYDAECTRLVQRSLQRNHYVSRLCLRFDHLENVDVPTLAAIVELAPQLTALDVSNNRISELTALTTTLASNTSLRSLNIGYNRLPPPQALEIADMLRVNGTLTELDASGNPFGDVGATHLISATYYNAGLQALHLDGMDLPEKLLGMVEVALRVNFNVDPVGDDIPFSA